MMRFWICQGTLNTPFIPVELGILTYEVREQYLPLPAFLLCLFPPSFPPSQDQLKRISAVQHLKVLGVRRSFPFKTLFYPKLDCFLLLIVGFFPSEFYPYSGLEKGELKETDTTVSWLLHILITLPNGILKPCQKCYVSNRAGSKWLWEIDSPVLSLSLLATSTQREDYIGTCVNSEGKSPLYNSICWCFLLLRRLLDFLVISGINSSSSFLKSSSEDFILIEFQREGRREGGERERKGEKH